MINVERKIKLGKKEKVILEYLKQFPNGIWKEDVIKEFSWASRYNGVISKRLERLAEKGLIVIKAEINPETGRTKQRIYLKE